MNDIRNGFLVLFAVILIVVIVADDNDENISNPSQRIETSVNEVSKIQPTSTSTTSTTTTTTTTTVPPTTTTTTVDNYDPTTHQLVNFSNLTNMPPNPYLCEIPRTGIREFYNWGRCLSFYNNVYPDFENSLVQIWYDGNIYTTEDPYPVCYWKGKEEDCNVVRRLQAKEDIDRTRDIIEDSISNMPP